MQPPPSTWSRFSHPFDGISAAFPAAPRDVWASPVDAEWRSLILAPDDPRAMRFSLELCRYLHPKKSIPGEDDVARWLALGLKRVERAAAVTHDGLFGRSVEGVDAHGDVVAMVAYIAGHDLYVQTVSAPPATFDRAQQAAFFDSLRVDSPLKVYSSIAGRFSLLVPASAQDQIADAGAPDALTRVFALGLPSKPPIVIATSEPIDASLRKLPPADLLRGIVAQWAGGAGRSTFPELQSIQTRGAAGLSFTFTTTHEPQGTVDHTLGRIFVVGDHVVSVRFIGATNQDLDSPLARDILESLRWAAPS
jgi:hypothetical protein